MKSEELRLSTLKKNSIGCDGCDMICTTIDRQVVSNRKSVIMKSAIFACVVAVIAFSCNDDAGVITEKVNENSIAGTWLYTEYGYSPGNGYVTEKVPSVPPQTLSFSEDFKIHTKMDGLSKFKFYRILENPPAEDPVIAFYEEDPGNTPQVLSELKHSYSMVWSGNSLKLHFRFCIEGCHMGFKRIADTPAAE